jgi:hypothetical protein
VHNSVTAPNATDEPAVTGDQVGRKLSAALRAQASGLGEQGDGKPPGRGPLHAQPRLAAWAVLALAILLGAMAGVLAGVISSW